MPRWKAPCRNAAQEEEADFPATPIPIFYQEPTGAYLPPYDHPDMLHQRRPHPPFSLPHHHRHKKGHRFGNPPKRTIFPFTGNIVPHGTGTMAAPPPAETEIPFQFQFGRCRIKNHRIPRLLFHLPVCLVRQKHRSCKTERLEISDRPRMIPVRMGDEKVFCSCRLLRCEIRYPVQSVRRSSRIHDKSVSPSFNKKAAASEITAAACNCYLHIHLH